jgi:DNA invertase Pin-like site-specific DNA recombinase
MSTDLQRYSIENQKDAIAEYALLHGIQIVRTYADEGRSGLTVKGRDALKLLLSDVQSGAVEFNTLLVYDVSRWGRFQDADESAHYEFICKSAGIAVIYCAELFDNNGSMLSTLLKVIKRAMAGEYSRELSQKVARAHKYHAQLGFHQGGPANFGLSRLLVDANNRPKLELQNGEAKSLQGDRVILVAGPDPEKQVVKEIFRLYVEEKMPHRAIARHLNKLGLQTRRGNSWSNYNVSKILRNEKYIGTFTYGMTTWPMLGGRIEIPRDKWTRVEGAIEPLVDRETFASAQRLSKDGWTFSNNELLDYLTMAWCVNGYLSAPRINPSRFTPTAVTYRERFGSLFAAYKLIGYKAVHVYRYSRCGPGIRMLHRNLICKLTEDDGKVGRSITYSEDDQVLILNESVSVAVVILPYLPRNNTVKPGWKLYLDRLEPCDVVLLARMNKANTKLLDYHVVPRRHFQQPSFRFDEENIGKFKAFRLPDLASFLPKAIRINAPRRRSETVFSAGPAASRADRRSRSG